MGMLSDDLDFLYGLGAFGTSRMTFSGATVSGYFDQEETLEADRTGDNILVKRTVFRYRTPKSTDTLASLTKDSTVTIYDPETTVTLTYVVSDPELTGDGKESRVILRPSTA
jgi:hypothetical protein